MMSTIVAVLRLLAQAARTRYRLADYCRTLMYIHSIDEKRNNDPLSAMSRSEVMLMTLEKPLL